MSRPHKLTALLVALVVLALAAPAAAAGPKIVFDKTEIVFPFVKEGENQTANFHFSNKGDQNLILDKVSPSCGCTVATFDKVVEPGQSGVVTMKLDTSGITGAFRKTAVVASNDPVNAYVTLVMLGETISRLKVDLGRRIELVGCLGQDVSVVATLSDPEDKPILITGLENPMKDYLQARLEPLPGGKSYRLHLKALSKQPVEFAGPLFLKVAGSPKVTLYVYCNVRGSYTLQPHEIHFGTVAKGMSLALQRAVLVEAACSDKLDLQGVDLDLKRYKLEERWVEKDKKLYLVLSPRVEVLAKGPFSDKLTVRANGQAYTVTLRGMVR